MGKSLMDMCPFSYWSVANVIKVRRQKDICMGKNQKDMYPFSYWREREVNSDYRGEFHQNPKTKNKRSVQARALARLALKKKKRKKK